MHRIKAIAAVLLLGASLSAQAAVTKNWSNVVVSGFVAGTNAWAIGSAASFPAGSCGTFTSGDFVIINEYITTIGGADPGVPTTPPGFTALFTPILGTGNDTRAAIFYKIAAGTESCTTGFISTWTNLGVQQTWSIVDYAGVDNVSPIDSHNETVAGFTGAATIVAPSTSPTGSTDALIGWFNQAGGLNPYAAPGSMTSDADNAGTGGTAESLIARQTLAASGATGTRTATNTGGIGTWSAGLIALKPAGGGGGFVSKMLLNAGAP